jgi:hypothetical protein
VQHLCSLELNNRDYLNLEAAYCEGILAKVNDYRQNQSSPSCQSSSVVTDKIAAAIARNNAA